MMSTAIQTSQQRRPLKIFITVDIELWPERWDLSDSAFRKCFDQFIHGKTPYGKFGLGFQLELLKAHNLKCVFFVEALFAGHYGTGPLEEIVEQIQAAGQEVQLHLHTEWLGRGRFHNPLHKKGYNLFNFSQTEQALLIKLGQEFLISSGAKDLSAFRAGNFGGNIETLRAAVEVGFKFDSSLHPRLLMNASQATLLQPEYMEGIFEFPLTIFNEWGGRFRQLQFGGPCSYREMADLLTQAWTRQWHSVVILSHGSELLNRAKTHPDKIVLHRFEKTCRFLADHQDKFQTAWFSEIQPTDFSAKPFKVAPLQSNFLNTGSRYIEQVTRRLYG
jgi:hypothetical protein